MHTSDLLTFSSSRSDVYVLCEDFTVYYFGEAVLLCLRQLVLPLAVRLVYFDALAAFQHELGLLDALLGRAHCEVR